jgi:hypothetical protein
VSAATPAAPDNAQVRATKTQLKAQPAVGETRVLGLTRAQVMAVGVSVALGLVVFGYGMAGFYVTISSLAARRGVPLATFVPAGIDGGLISVVVLDLVLVWVGNPVGWLRQVVRLLSAGTIVANTVSGWPDPVAVGLHGAAPVMVLAMVEAGRTVLLRRLGVKQGTVRDSIPLIRWALAPWRTALLWRRMVLWQITSYRAAVDVELDIRRAMALLRVHYGRGWRRSAPGDVVWMLRTGVAVGEVFARVEELAGIRGVNSRSVSGVAVPESLPTPSIDDGGPGLLSQTVDGDDGRFAEAVRLNREHWTRTGRPISAETLRKRLHLGAATARVWSRMIRAADRAAVCGRG